MHTVYMMCHSVLCLHVPCRNYATFIMSFTFTSKDMYIVVIQLFINPLTNIFCLSSNDLANVHVEPRLTWVIWVTFYSIFLILQGIAKKKRERMILDKNTQVGNTCMMQFSWFCLLQTGVHVHCTKCSYCFEIMKRKSYSKVFTCKKKKNYQCNVECQNSKCFTR